MKLTAADLKKLAKVMRLLLNRAIHDPDPEMRTKFAIASTELQLMLMRAAMGARSE